MSTQTERLVATLNADSTGFQKALKQVATEAKATEAAIDSVGKSAQQEMAAGLDQATKSSTALAAAEEKVAAAAQQVRQSSQDATAGMARMEASMTTHVKSVDGASTSWGRYKGVIDGAVTKMGPAGEMVNKITTLLGPMGFAIGGVTAAFVGLNLGVGAFNDATTRMLEKTEEGAAILAQIQPEFVSFSKVLEEQFEAQRDLIDVGARAQAVNAAWKEVLNGLVAPFTAFGQLLGGVADAFLGVEDRAVSLREEMARVSQQAESDKAFERYKQGLANLDESIGKYVEAQQEQRDATAEGEQLLGDLQVKIANRVAAKYSSEAIRLDVFTSLLRDREALVRNATEEERDQLLALAEARDKAAEAALREGQAAVAARSRSSRTARTAAPTEDAGAGIESAMDRVHAAQQEAAERAKTAEAERMAQLVADKQVEAELAQKQLDLNEQLKASQESATAKSIELLAQEKSARQELAAYMGQYVGGFVTSMARVSIAQAKDDKERRRAYRTAVADQIQALGDYAATKSIVSAAEGNFAMAATLATAAATAYATASIMRPSQAPSAAAAGAAPAAAPQQTQLTTINNTLVLNDAFSDTEQVARRFATVYKSTTDRGLIPQGA